MIKDQTVESYADSLASGSATPGGGAAAAITVVQAAALITMACNLTLGRRRFAAQSQEVERLKSVSEGVRALALAAAQEDVVAFERVRGAYSLQPDDPSRQEVLQLALKAAALVPARLFEPMESLAVAAQELRPICNPNLVSDIDVALNLLLGAAAGLSVMAKVNLDLVHDEEFHASVQSLLQRAMQTIEDAGGGERKANR